MFEISGCKGRREAVRMLVDREGDSKMSFIRKFGWLCALVAMTALVSGGVATAQTFRGTILGMVTDSSGAAVSGANVTVKNVDTGLVRTVTTSADGTYSAPELPIGTYSV